MTVTCGDKRWEATAGSFVFLPRGIMHGFTVTGDTPLRGLQLTAPAGVEGFIAEAGEPAQSPAMAASDIEKTLAAPVRHHSDGHTPTDAEQRPPRAALPPHRAP